MPKTPPLEQKTDDPLAITAMVLGVTAVTCLGFITGIPAIILAIISLARKSPSRGLNIAGLVTGIIGTVVSLLFIAFIGLLIYIAAAYPEMADPATTTPSDTPAHHQVRT